MIFKIYHTIARFRKDKDTLIKCAMFTLFTFNCFPFSQVPPKHIKIRDQKGRNVENSTIGPYDQGTNVTLVCESKGGKKHLVYYKLGLVYLSFCVQEFLPRFCNGSRTMLWSMPAILLAPMELSRTSSSSITCHRAIWMTNIFVKLRTWTVPPPRRPTSCLILIVCFLIIFNIDLISNSNYLFLSLSFFF